MKRRLLSVAVLLFVGAAVYAQTPRSMLDGKPGLAKVVSQLLEVRYLAAEGRPAEEIAAAVPLAPMRDGLAEIEVRLQALTPQILAEVSERGMEVTGSSYRWARIRGFLDPDLLDEIAAIPAVTTIRLPSGYRAWAGSVTSQGDASINAVDARTSFGVDGSGVKVGVVSPSFHRGLGGTESGGACVCTSPGGTCANVVTGMVNQASGDLPPSVVIVSDPIVAGDEGAALGEIVHDLAPGAEIMFRTGGIGEADMADGITQLVNCGADLIVDNILYMEEPMFQDGPIAQAAQNAVDSGVAYVSAAGNLGAWGVRDFYRDSNASDEEAIPSTGIDFHDFDPGAGVNTFAAITLPPGCGVGATLQWSEPFSGALGPGVSSNLDLYLLDNPSGPFDLFLNPNMLSASWAITGCANLLCPPDCGDPQESVFYTNTTGSANTVYLVVEHFCGDEDVELRLVTDVGGPCLITDLTFDGAVFADAQLYGHAAAEGALAVAASDYREIDLGGDFVAPLGVVNVEKFSSAGGDLPFYFDGAGAPLPNAPQSRPKPEVTAPDGTNTTFFIPTVDVEPDGFPNFFGASASAAHAAAVGALMLQGTNLSPSGLGTVLSQSATDIEDTGRDALSGLGLINALRSVGGIQPSLASCNCGLPNQSCPDELVFDAKPNTGLQTIRACVMLTVGGADFTEITGIAPAMIFTDGFESGDVSVWSDSVP